MKEREYPVRFSQRAGGWWEAGTVTGEGAREPAGNQEGAVRRLPNRVEPRDISRPWRTANVSCGSFFMMDSEVSRDVFTGYDTGVT